MSHFFTVVFTIHPTTNRCHFPYSAPTNPSPHSATDSSTSSCRLNVSFVIPSVGWPIQVRSLMSVGLEGFFIRKYHFTPVPVQILKCIAQPFLTLSLCEQWLLGGNVVMKSNVVPHFPNCVLVNLKFPSHYGCVCERIIKGPMNYFVHVNNIKFPWLTRLWSSVYMLLILVSIHP